MLFYGAMNIQEGLIYLRGERAHALNTHVALADFYGVSADYILGQSVHPSAPGGI